MCVLSCLWLFSTPRTVALQAPLSMGFSRQEYWSGLLSASPGDLPNPGATQEAQTLGYSRMLIRLWQPWIAISARRSNKSILKEISPAYSLEGLMLKLQYFSHLMWSIDSFEKTLMLGKIEGGRWRGRQRMRWLEGIILANFMDRGAWRATVHGVANKSGTT